MSLKHCSYSKHLLSFWYQISRDNILHYQTCISFFFFLKIKRSTAPSDYKCSWTSFHGNAYALNSVFMMAWELNLQSTILLFKGSTAKEGTGLLPSLLGYVQYWRVQGLLTQTDHGPSLLGLKSEWVCNVIKLGVSRAATLVFSRWWRLRSGLVAGSCHSAPMSRLDGHSVSSVKHIVPHDTIFTWGMSRWQQNPCEPVTGGAEGQALRLAPTFLKYKVWQHQIGFALTRKLCVISSKTLNWDVNNVCNNVLIIKTMGSELTSFFPHRTTASSCLFYRDDMDS